MGIKDLFKRKIVKETIKETGIATVYDKAEIESECDTLCNIVYLGPRSNDGGGLERLTADYVASTYEQNDNFTYEDGVRASYQTNKMMSIKVKIDSTKLSDLANKNFTIGLYNTSTLHDLVDNIEVQPTRMMGASPSSIEPYDRNSSNNGDELYVKTPLIPVTYLKNRRLDVDVFNDPAFSIRFSLFPLRSRPNVNCMGRVLSDSVQFYDNKILTKGKSLTLTMDELDFYPTKVIFTASHLTVIDSNNMRRYLKDLTLVAYDGEHLQDDNSTNVYYDPYGDIYIKMVLAGNKLVFITDRNITVHFYGTDKITLDGSVRTDGVCDIINRDYRFTAYMDQSIKPIEFVNYAPEINVDETNYQKYVNLMLEFDMLSNVGNGFDGYCIITDLDTNETYNRHRNVINTNIEAPNGNGDTSRYMTTLANIFSYNARETHSFLIKFKFMTSHNIIIESKPFIIKGNITHNGDR